MGTLEDWKSLYQKISYLEKYSVNKNWKKYIENVLAILQQFIWTFEGKPDLDFWNSIMNSKKGRLGSGSTEYVTGWIKNLFYDLIEKDEVSPDDFVDLKVAFDIKIENQIKSVTKMVQLTAGFNGLFHQNGAFRPQLSMLILDPTNNK